MFETRMNTFRAEMGEKVIINIKTFVDGHVPPDRVLPGEYI